VSYTFATLETVVLLLLGVKIGMPMPFRLCGCTEPCNCCKKHRPEQPKCCEGHVDERPKGSPPLLTYAEYAEASADF
jgi:hypothetical protein